MITIIAVILWQNPQYGVYWHFSQWKLTPVLGSLTPVLGSLIPVLGSLTPVLGSLTPVLGSITPVLGSLTPVLGVKVKQGKEHKLVVS